MGIVCMGNAAAYLRRFAAFYIKRVSPHLSKTLPRMNADKRGFNNGLPGELLSFI